MTPDSQSIPGDQARVSVLVGVAPEVAFRMFTEEINLWWRRGPKYRIADTGRGSIEMEPRQGGRVFESFKSGSDTKSVEIGKITVWEPPSRLVFDWRGANFSAGEKTEVSVTFQRTSSGTLVTVTHRGWSRIRADHPVRHNLETSPFIGMIGLWWGDLMTSLRDYSSGRRTTAE